MSAMVPIYVSLIIKGKKKFSDTPADIKDDVRAELIAQGHEDLINE